MFSRIYSSFYARGVNSFSKNGARRGYCYATTAILFFAFLLGMSFSSASAGLLDMVSNYFDARSYSIPAHGFYESLFLGGFPSYPEGLPAPPSGDGVLKGKFIYKNKPAKGVILFLVLNAKYKTKKVVTDEEGIFAVSLPPGEWLINRVDTESWEEKPEKGSYSLFYGGEEKLIGDNYENFTYFDSPGYEVNVTEDSNLPQITITIKDDLEIVWPDIREKQVEATIDDKISWKKYPEAAKYFIEIQRITREGRTTRYEPIISEVLADQNSLPLSDLKHISTEEQKTVEYAVEILAFSEDGTPIAKSPDSYDSGTFILSDGNALIEDSLGDEYDFSSISSPEEYEKKIEVIMLNEGRAEAVMVLIEEDMLPAAEALLGRIDADVVPGRKEALSGCILALQGKCDEAKEMFNSAMTINPGVCIPDTYRNLCD